MTPLTRAVVWLNTGDNHIKAMAGVLLTLLPLVWWLSGDWSPLP